MELDTLLSTIGPGMTNEEKITFGYWLSGFTDGEGCFELRMQNRNDKSPVVARFSIKLRSDDVLILNKIKNYLCCGEKIAIRKHKNYDGYDRQTQAEFTVSNIKELSSIVVPFFEHFPLRAKKQRDFMIWKEGVNRVRMIRLRSVKPCDKRWFESDIQKIAHLVNLLRSTRKFTDHPDINKLVMPIRQELKGLW